MIKHLLVMLVGPLALLATLGRADEPGPTLAQRLQPLLQAHRGKVTIAVKASRWRRRILP